MQNITMYSINKKNTFNEEFDTDMGNHPYGQSNSL